ncbi:MAG: septum formation protein Maf [Tissierellia bacterium]|mgnify:CR=1 FL=1|nr:septum formation protein Maf [Tissierellia bacterium]
MNNIVLASSSPRRIELLKKFNIDPIIIKPNIVEKVSIEDSVEEISMALAFEKANQVSNNFNNGEIIMAFDTLVAYDGEILGKPKSEDDAINMLKLLSNKEHVVVTGLSIIKANTNIKVIDYEKTYVKFRQLDDKIIKNYINTQEYKDKAGAYGIQGIGGVLIEWINGCYFNVVGLPLYRLDILLDKHFDIRLL